MEGEQEVSRESIQEETPAGAKEQQENLADLMAPFIEALAASAVRSREEDYQYFSAELVQTLDALKTAPSPPTLTQCVHLLLPKFEQYQQNTQRHIHGLIAQLRGMIRTLISAIGSIRSDSDAPELDEIEREIMELQTLEGLAMARENLELALGQLTKAERVRKQEAASLLKRLHERVLILEDYKSTAAQAQPSQDQANASQTEAAKLGAPSAAQPTLGKAGIPNPTEAPVDRLTGLLTRDAAEAAIIALETNPRNKYLAAFYIQNMQQLNVRFGERVGDELLFLITQRIVTSLLRPSDQIFRWRGPAFVAIIEREEGFLYVGHELKRSVEHPFQFEFRSGSLLVFISIAAELLCVAHGTAAEHILQLETYFSSF